MPCWGIDKTCGVRDRHFEWQNFKFSCRVLLRWPGEQDGIAHGSVALAGSLAAQPELPMSFSGLPESGQKERIV